MTIDKIISYIWDGKDWIFSGIGIAAIGFIVRLIKQKKIDGNVDSCWEKNLTHDNNYVDGEKNRIIQNDISGTISVKGSGNVAGNGNIVTNNYYYADSEKKCENSWFSERFNILLSLLNDTRKFNEKEYTVEYISSIMGFKNVGELKVYLIEEKEPDDELKEKFVKKFGVNRDWIVYGRGGYPFASNIVFKSKDPMDILRKENLKDIIKFVVVIGMVEGRRNACIIRQSSELCYELYPKFFILNSYVGSEGIAQLVQFYRFLREASKIKKLDATVYLATENQMNQLMRGEFSPKKVERFEVARNFIDDFMSISQESIEKNKTNMDDDFISVQKIIASNIEDYDRIEQEDDTEAISRNFYEKYERSHEENNDVDLFDSTTTFFDYRFGKAFPGVRGIKEFTNPEECVDRLQILLKKPLSGKKMGGPIWWIRGSTNSDIRDFKRIADDKFLLDGSELKVKRIIVYAAYEYYKKFVYVETYPEEKTGLYEIDENLVNKWVDTYGYYYEEYAEYEGRKITRAEYDDGAAVLDGKVVDLNGKAQIRTRYITPYNFIICAHFNPMNATKYDNIIGHVVNGILKGQNSVEDIIKIVEKMEKHIREM